MIRRSRFLIDQIVEQLFARRLIFAMRMHCRQVRRKSCDVMVILPRIIRECFSAEFPACPREIKRMFQEMFRRNVVIDGIEVFVHYVLRMNSSDRLTQILTDQKARSEERRVGKECRYRW